MAAECWERTQQSFASLNLDTREVIVHQDQDSVYTSYDWVRILLIDHEARISYSETGAKGNPWVEAMWGRIKTKTGSLITEARDLAELEEIIAQPMT